MLCLLIFLFIKLPRYSILHMISPELVSFVLELLGYDVAEVDQVIKTFL